MIKINLMKGDCLEKMKEIPDNSVDMVLTDPPYGTTACKWDSVIPFDKMWAELKRIVKSEKSAIVLFGAEPFSSALRMSNIKEFRYDWIWNKKVASNSQLVKHQPLKTIEDIIVFSSGTHYYFPQGTTDCFVVRSNKNRSKGVGHIGSEKLRKEFIQTKTGYPRNILEFKPFNIGKLHPTQKPVPLLEYLIKTYTMEGETVLDFTMGSGSTGVACKNLNRNFIGIERDDNYFEIAKNRIEQA
jgi:DNA modification methylase